jgi:hypothetical protein
VGKANTETAAGVDAEKNDRTSQASSAVVCTKGNVVAKKRKRGEQTPKANSNKRPRGGKEKGNGHSGVGERAGIREVRVSSPVHGVES